MTKLKDDEHWVQETLRIYNEDEMNATAFHSFWMGVGLGSLGIFIAGVIWYFA